jgi:hypothetical protein
MVVSEAEEHARVVVVEVPLEKSGTPDPNTATADMEMFVLFGGQKRSTAGRRRPSTSSRR